MATNGLKLSELIAQAQRVLETHGDVDVWVRTTTVGYDDNEEISLPVIMNPQLISVLRDGRSVQVFLLWGD